MTQKKDNNQNMSDAAKASLKNQVTVRNQDADAIEKMQAPREYLEKMMAASEKQFLRLLANDSKAVLRLYRVTMNYISKNPKLMECAPESIIGCMLISSELGLEFGYLGQAHMIPYKNKKKNYRLEAQFIPGYQGLMLLAQRTGSIVNTNAAVVYEGDKFQYEYGMNAALRHVPSMEDKKGRQRMCCYAYAKTTSGFYFTVLSMTDLEKIRAVSQSKDSPAWKDWTDEMYEKTAFRKLTKLLPKEASLEHLKLWKASILDDAASQGLAQGLDPNAFDDMEGVIINETEIYSEVDKPDKQLVDQSKEIQKKNGVKSINEHITGKADDDFNPELFNQPSYHIEQIELMQRWQLVGEYLEVNSQQISMFSEAEQSLIKRVADAQIEKLKGSSDG